MFTINTATFPATSYCTVAGNSGSWCITYCVTIDDDEYAAETLFCFETLPDLDKVRTVLENTVNGVFNFSSSEHFKNGDSFELYDKAGNPTGISMQLMDADHLTRSVQEL